MNKEKRRALEGAGWVFGDAEDFLELTIEERHLVALRLAVSRAVRMLREKQNLTQTQVAKKLKTSQPRVVKIEAGASDVSLDLLFRSLFTLGGTLKDLRLKPNLSPPGSGQTQTAKGSKR
jgi:DNA-binding XRE family transcriptional regulator